MEIRFCEPPEPPAGEDWCQFCLMLAKAALTRANRVQLEEIARDRKPGVHWVPWNNKIILRPGRYHAFSDMPSLGLLLLCWDHVAGIQIDGPPSLPPVATHELPPGLFKGRG